MKARENKSDIESELKSEDPTEVDDMVFSEEEESREVIVTPTEHRDPMAMFAGDEQEAERRAVVPVPRKRATSADAAGEREVKWTRSPRPSVVSPVSSPPATGVTEQARQLEERACTHVSPGPVPAHGSQLGDAPPAVDAIEQAGRFEESTGTRASCDSQLEEAPPTTDMVEQAEQSEEWIGTHASRDS